MSFLIIPPFDLDEDGAFERASSATYFDSSGVMRTAAIDEPRFSYNPETLEFEGLLIEEQGTNLLTYSEQFDNAAWTKVNTTITANAETAPDGTVTMDRMVETTASGAGAIRVCRQDKTITLGDYLTVFCVGKEVAGSAKRYLNISLSESGNQYAYARFDLATGLVTASAIASSLNYFSNINADVEVLGDGRYKCILTVKTDGFTALQVRIGMTAAPTGIQGAASGFLSYAGDGTSGLYIWGAQLEVGTFPTSYIKTEASQVTREADIVTGVVSNVPENDYPEWDVATGYDLGERVIVISDNGSPEVFYHNVYESLIAGTGTNTGNDPTLDLQWPDGEPVNWILVGATNRWKMFDDKNSSQTVNADSIDVAVTVTSRPTSLFLGNVECQRIEVCQKGADGTIYYQNAFEMIENSGEPSYYNWLFQQIRKRTDLLIGDLVPLSGGVISIRLINTGGMVKCGTCLIGYAEEIGGTQYGAGVGIQDFSVKQQNEFGDYRILERAYSREGDFTVMVDNGNIDRVQNLLASRRAKPTLYIGTELYRCTYIYGFFSDMNNVITYPQQSLLNINIKGLT